MDCPLLQIEPSECHSGGLQAKGPFTIVSTNNKIFLEQWLLLLDGDDIENSPQKIKGKCAPSLQSYLKTQRQNIFTSAHILYLIISHKVPVQVNEQI